MYLERTIFQPYRVAAAAQYGYRLYNEDGFAEFCDGLGPAQLDATDAEFLRTVYETGGLAAQSALEALADRLGELHIDERWYRLCWDAGRKHIGLQLL